MFVLQTIVAAAIPVLLSLCSGFFLFRWSNSDYAKSRDKLPEALRIVGVSTIALGMLCGSIYLSVAVLQLVAFAA